VQRTKQPRERAKIYAVITDHFWKVLLKIYKYFFSKYKAEELLKTTSNSNIEQYDLDKRAHTLTIMHIAEKMAAMARAPLVQFGEEMADRHARVFSNEFIHILEELLLVWPESAADR
jgi:hypothetical protein